MGIEADRKVLVTGGASGFGLAAAVALSEAGAQVAIADLDEAALQTAARECGHPLLPVQLDVTDSEQVRQGVDLVAERFGGLDTLVMCAGVIKVSRLEDVTERDWDQTLAVNLKGAFLASQAAAPLLSASGRGRIVAISSDAGKRGFPLITAYCASKFGLIGLCESIAAELAPTGVTVNCVCPASCPNTGMGQMLTAWKVDQSGRDLDQTLQNIAATFPLGRYVEIEDVVSTIMFLLSREASLLTGLAIDIDGGMHLGGAIPGTAAS